MKYDPPTINGFVDRPTKVSTVTGAGGNTAPPGMDGMALARRLKVTTSADGAADGAAFTTQPVVEVRNSVGQAITGNTSTVTVEVASGNATLSGTTSVAAVDGVATFTDLVLDSIDGSLVTLRYRAAGAYPVVDPVQVAIAPGAVTSLVFQTAPVGAASGAVLATQPVIKLLDADGFLCTNDSSTVITAAKKSGTGTLSGTTTATAVNGVATFTNLKMTTAGTYVLKFTTGALELDSATLTTS